MEEELIGIKNTALSFIIEAKDLENLEETKLQFLGKSGKLTLALKEVTKLPAEQRPAFGILANEVKKTIEDAIAEQQVVLKNQKQSRILEKIDITNPGIKPPLGNLHLV